MVDTPGKVTLWGIEVFAAIAEERSISAAARRLGASVSAASQQLSNLETALGAVLVDRHMRPFALTPAGELFRARAQAILNEAAEARAELAVGNLSRLGRVNLGMIEDFDADVTPRLLAQMGAELTQSRFLLETGASHRLHDLLEARALDMIVAAEMAPPPDWAEVHPLLEEPFVAAVPRGVTAAQAITALPFIQYTTRHLMGRQIAAHLGREGVTLDHRFELDSYHAIMAMVAEGAGWSILTPLGFMRAGRFRDRAEVLPLPFAPLERRVSLTARRGVLLDMPGRVAERLKPLLSELIVGPCRARMPWSGDGLRIL
jgi:DNA-binding transcriptional LysR family regulator